MKKYIKIWIVFLTVLSSGVFARVENSAQSTNVELCLPDPSIIHQQGRYQEKNYIPQAILATIAQQKISFAWPVSICQCWISSLFGKRGKGFHAGVDFAASKGRAVYATADGVVTTHSENLDSNGYGRMIVIDHKHGYKSRYAHLDSIAVQLGQKIKQGDKIGTVGATGHVITHKAKGDPSHLHFEIMYKNAPVDPLIYLFASNRAIK